MSPSPPGMCSGGISSRVRPSSAIRTSPVHRTLAVGEAEDTGEVGAVVEGGSASVSSALGEVEGAALFAASSS